MWAGLLGWEGGHGGRHKRWNSGPHEWAGAGPTTSTLVAVPPVADPSVGPPSTSTVAMCSRHALTPPHHLAGYNHHDRPEGRRGGCA